MTTIIDYKIREKFKKFVYDELHHSELDQIWLDRWRDTEIQLMHEIDLKIRTNKL